MSTGAELIAAEREKQKTKWGERHDDGHRMGELADAAIFFAEPPTRPGSGPSRLARVFVNSHGVSARYLDPWRGIEAQKEKHDRVNQLVVAGALIAAEIDRLQRVK